MTPASLRLLNQWASTEGFGRQTAAEAAVRLAELLPHYPHPSEQPVEICANGYRWFTHEMEAVADALHRQHKRPLRQGSTMASPDWITEANRDGLWAVAVPVRLKAGQEALCGDIEPHPPSWTELPLASPCSI